MIIIANIQLTIRNMSVGTCPFEGFFVGSVEFCKHVKLDKDDRKDVRDRDNRTGTQGPPGLAGPQGPQGIQGPIGLMEHKVLQVSLTQNYVQQGQTWRMYMY